MTPKERAAIQQALEALEVSTDWDVGARGKQLQSMKAIAALREALAEQAEQEPVGYWDGKFSKGGASALYEVPQESAFEYHYENYPLYAAPVRTKDLTDDEIGAINLESLRSQRTNLEHARAVIAADREKNRG